MSIQSTKERMDQMICLSIQQASLGLRIEERLLFSYVVS